MKIGDVEITKIPSSDGVECRNGCSSNAISYFNGTPYCADCLRVEQQKKWDEDGNFFINSEGKRVHYGIVKKSPIDES